MGRFGVDGKGVCFLETDGTDVLACCNSCCTALILTGRLPSSISNICVIRLTNCSGSVGTSDCNDGKRNGDREGS